MIHLFEKDSNESLLKTRGRDLIVDGLKSFVLMRSNLLAIERQQYLGRPAPERLWEAPCRGGRCMIKAGDHIVVGCDNDGLECTRQATAPASLTSRFRTVYRKPRVYADGFS